MVSRRRRRARQGDQNNDAPNEMEEDAEAVREQVRAEQEARRAPDRRREEDVQLRPDKRRKIGRLLNLEIGNWETKTKVLWEIYAGNRHQENILINPRSKNGASFKKIPSETRSANVQGLENG